MFISVLKAFFKLGYSFLLSIWKGLKTILGSFKRILVFVFLIVGGILIRYSYANYNSLTGFSFEGLFNKGVFIDWLIVDFYYIAPFLFLMFFTVKSRFQDILLYSERKKYNAIFQEIAMFWGNKAFPSFPLYLGKNIAKNSIKLSFYSLLPLSVWEKKKEQLEMYLNTSINELNKNGSNNRVIELIIYTSNIQNFINWDICYLSNKDILNIGVSLRGVVGMELKNFPHAFIAGETGSGKSVILRCMIYQALLKNYEVKLIDFKRGVAFSSFSSYIDIIKNLENTDKLFKSAVTEMNKRLDLFVSNKVQDIFELNKKGFKMRIMTIFIDEFAEVMDKKGAVKEEKNLIESISKNIRSLIRTSRAAGIFIISGIQRPDAELIGGQIKSNVAFRISGKFSDKEPSIIVLGDDSATKLPNIKGRCLVKGNGTQEVQAFYFDDNMIDFNRLNENYKNCFSEMLAVPIFPEPVQPAEPEIVQKAMQILKNTNDKSNSNVIDFNFDDTED